MHGAGCSAFEDVAEASKGARGGFAGELRRAQLRAVFLNVDDATAVDDAGTPRGKAGAGAGESDQKKQEDHDEAAEGDDFAGSEAVAAEGRRLVDTGRLETGRLETGWLKTGWLKTGWRHARTGRRRSR
jgi:hypothetical protein